MHNNIKEVRISYLLDLFAREKTRRKNTMPAPAVAKARKIEIETPNEEKKQIESEAKKAA